MTAYVENCIFYKFFIISNLLFYKMYDKYTGKTIHVCIYSFSILCI